MLLILLIFLKHAFGQKGWSSHDVLPHQKWHDHKIASPQGAQFSVLEAPVTGSIPFEEVVSNVLAGKSLNAIRSRFPLSRQHVKGGISSSHASMSHTQSAPSSSVSASLALPQNLLAASHQYVPTLESSSGSSSQPQGTTSQYAPIFSLGAKVPVSSQYYPATLSGSSQSLSQSSQKWQPSTSRTDVFQPSSTAVLQGFQTSGASQSISQYPSRFVSLSSASVDGSSLQRQGTSSQYAPASLDAKVPVYSQAAPSGFSLSTSQPSQWQPSTSRWSQGFQASGTVASQGFQTSGTATSQSSSPTQGSKSTSRLSTLTSAASPGNLFSTQDGSGRYSGLFSQSQSASSQYAPTALDAKVPVYSQAVPSGFSLSTSQPSEWQPSTSRWSQGFQASSTVASESSSPTRGSKSPSRFSTLTSAASPGQSFSNVYTSSSQSRAGAQLAGSSRDVPVLTGSTSTDGSSLQLQGTSSQYAPASLVSKVPLYKPAAPSGSSSLSQPSQWHPSTSRWSQGFQASGTVASQSRSPTQGFKSTLTSAASPGNLFSTQDGSGRYSGLFSQSQSASSQYAPTALDAKVPVYSQAAPSRFSLSTSQPSEWQPSTSRWSQGFQASGTVPSLSRSPTQGFKSTLTSAASPGNLFSTQDGNGRYSDLFSQSQSASTQYAPTALDAKVPVYSQAAPSGFSLSTIQPSQWQPSTSRLSQGFQASGTVAPQGFQTSGTATSQSSSPTQGSKSPSRFSTLTSAASPGNLFSTQDGSGRYSGLFSQSQSASSQYAPTALDAKVPVYSQVAPSGFSLSTSQPSQWQPSTSRWSQGFQASSTVASQSSSPTQGSKSPSRFSTLTSAASPGQSFSNVYTSSSQSRAGAQLAGSSRDVPVQTGSTSTDGSSLQLQGTSSQYAPASLVSKVPPYKPAAPSGSSSLSQPSQWQPITSRWSQGFQASGTVASQSNTPTQGFKSTLTSAASPGNLFSTQHGSGSYSGLFSQSQSTSSQYAPTALDAKVPVYSQAAPSGFSLSMSQPSEWQPSTSRWSQGFQASGTVPSLSSSPTQGFKSTLTSAASPSNLFSTQDGNGRYSGLFSQSQSASSHYAPTALDAKVPVYSQAAPSGFSLLTRQPSTSRWSQGLQASGTVASQSSSPSQGSKSTSRLSTLTSASPGQSFSNVYTSSSQSRAGAQLAGSSRDVPVQTGSTSTDVSSLQLQGTSSQYAPASLVSKVPLYKPAAPSGSLSLSQLSQWQPSTSRWSQGFQASGTVASQSRSPSQGSKYPSRFFTTTSDLRSERTDSTYGQKPSWRDFSSVKG